MASDNEEHNNEHTSSGPGVSILEAIERVLDKTMTNPATRRTMIVLGVEEVPGTNNLRPMAILGGTPIERMGLISILERMLEDVRDDNMEDTYSSRERVSQKVDVDGDVTVTMHRKDGTNNTASENQGDASDFFAPAASDIILDDHTRAKDLGNIPEFDPARIGEYLTVFFSFGAF